MNKPSASSGSHPVSVFRNREKTERAAKRDVVGWTRQGRAMLPVVLVGDDWVPYVLADRYERLTGLARAA